VKGKGERNAVHSYKLKINTGTIGTEGAISEVLLAGGGGWIRGITSRVVPYKNGAKGRLQSLQMRRKAKKEYSL